jgi:endoglucanase
MELNIELFREICEAPGAPGYENKIRKVILREIKDFADEISVDNMGNVIALRKGNGDGPKLMVAAHMDEIGFMVSHIDEHGFLRFHPLGGFDPKTLTAQRVIVHGKKDLMGVMGSKPIHVMTAEERAKLPVLTDYFIDIGLPYEEVIKYVSVGTPITRERGLIEIGHCVNSKSIDNRVSVFMLVETLRELKGVDLPCDFYAAFTVQEEVGLRGASVAAHQVDPDFGIALDTTIAYDLPAARNHEMITRLGEGVAIKVMDSSVVCDQRMVRFMQDRAEAAGIKFQMEVLPAGGTDTGALQRYGKRGSIAGALSIPTRHLHQVIEMAHKEDIRNGIDLLKECILHLKEYDWMDF